MEELVLDGKQYISSKQAAKITGYTKDYIGQLCRAGKLPARLLGRNWYVEEHAADAHRKRTKYVNASRPDERSVLEETQASAEEYAPEIVRDVATGASRHGGSVDTRSPRKESEATRQHITTSHYKPRSVEQALSLRYEHDDAPLLPALHKTVLHSQQEVKPAESTATTARGHRTPPVRTGEHEEGRKSPHSVIRVGENTRPFVRSGSAMPVSQRPYATRFSQPTLFRRKGNLVRHAPLKEAQPQRSRFHSLFWPKVSTRRRASKKSSFRRDSKRFQRKNSAFALLIVVVPLLVAAVLYGSLAFEDARYYERGVSGDIELHSRTLHSRALSF